jgi:hypothetical protein
MIQKLTNELLCKRDAGRKKSYFDLNFITDKIEMPRKTIKRKYKKRLQSRKQKGRGFFTSPTEQTTPCTTDTSHLFKTAASIGEAASGCDEFAYRDEFLTPERKVLLDTLQSCPNMQSIHQQVKNAFIQSCEQKNRLNQSNLQRRAARVRKLKYGTTTVQKGSIQRQEGKRDLFEL